ncbi:putative secreted protein [Moritella sp. JT01]|nr:putative secreted protein [Moritella sp. JT01]
MLAFEGKYGGHSIDSYNRELELMWAGVIPKSKDGAWVASMDSYWFKKMADSKVE